MATQAIQGRKGTLAVMSASSSATTTLVAEVKDYKFSVTQDIIDATSNDSSGWKEGISGVRNWSLDIGAILAYKDTEQTTIRKALSSGTLRFFILTPTTKGSTGGSVTQKYKGWGNIKGYDVSSNQNAAWLANFSVEGTRALVYTS